ncbi:MAG: site-2 protease family protein [Verrucomicrobiales bacterium]
MFGPSLSLGSAAGIPIRIHWTFSLLMLWAAFANFAFSGSLAIALLGVVFLMVVFGCVVLHELGHSLTARRYGIRTRSITLSPIGGVAALDSSPRHWKGELWIALAGPAVNVVIALFLAPVVLAVGAFSPIMAEPFSTLGNFLFMILLANVILAVFNMVPAFPMDGGRILRALLASRTSRITATNVAARIGQGFAIVMAVFGLVFSPFLTIIAVFVFLAAEMEKRSVAFEETLSGATVSDVMRDSFATVGQSTTVDEVLSAAMRTGQDSFPVMSDGRLRGLVDLPSLIQARRAGKGHVPVAEIVDPRVTPVSPGDELTGAFRNMQLSDRDVLPVLSDDRLVGLLPQRAIISFQTLHGV